jgi:hypothetical protein
MGLKLSKGTKQHDLIIAPEAELAINVDNIEVAQFIYLLRHNRKIHDVIDTVTSKAVLILGSFTEGRKAILEALRDELRNRNYLPILFDFDKPDTRTTDETITLLARMARANPFEVAPRDGFPQRRDHRLGEAQFQFR